MEIEEAKRRARKGPAILLMRRVFALMINFLATVTVARLVSPREFGLAAMAAVLLSLGQIFRDFGLTNAVLRKGQVSHEEMNLIFWLNCALTITVAGIIAIGSPWVARFYGEDVVTSIILLSLIGFVLDGFSLQHRALINRELRFQTIAMIDMASLTVGFVTTLSLAFLWRNVWAIVIGTSAQVIVGALLNVLLSGFKPGRPRRNAEARSLLLFGINTSVYSIGTFFSQNAAPVLIGHSLGSALLGQYNRAWALFQLPSANFIQPLTQSVMPLLTRLRGHDGEYRAAYVSLVRKLCAFLMPFAVFLMFASSPLVYILLGPNWSEAGQVLGALAPALIGTGLGFSAGDLFITQDRSAELRSLGLFEIFLRVGAVAIGLQFGLTATAMGYSLSTLMAAGVRMYVSGKTGPVSRMDQLMAAVPGAIMATGTAVGCAAALALSSYVDEGALVRATLAGMLGCVGAVGVGLVIPGCRNTLIELVDSFGLKPIMRKLVRPLFN